MTPPAPPARVLVVDDNRDAADTAALVLRLAGFDARACYGGSAALAEARGFRPVVCLLDLDMPGMDGDELGARLRRLAGDLGDPPPALAAVTARSDAAGRGRTAAAGFARHLVKPADPAELAAAVGELAGPARTPGPPAPAGDGVTAGELARRLAAFPADTPVRFGEGGLFTFCRVVACGGAAHVTFNEVPGVEYAALPGHRRAAG